ncbi:puromycin-sensitive aminopeptidase-like, partial [Tropilaelaps mercedesae]
VLDFATSGSLRTQETMLVIESVGHSALGQELVWAHFTANFDTYNRRYSSGSLFSRLCKASAKNFCSLDRAKEVREFFRKHRLPGVERTVRQLVEVIESNSSWLTRDEQQIRDFLK